MDGALGDEGSLSDLPTRPMRVKILYTFDTEAKTTCLARLPETLSIPVVPIDEQFQVGVIELQQCIQAIISASPEILSRLDSGDFTVYNFDYTEYDTPIVGQGRLSSLLAASSSPENKAMITGRVCKNIQALFTNGVKETLEVKFKLTPLSRPSANEYGKSMDGARSLSPATSAGFDPNAWNNSMQQNKMPQQQSSEYFGFDSFGSSDGGAAMMEEIFGMPSGSSGDTSRFQQPGGVGMSETLTDASFAPNPAFAAQSHSAPGSRAGSPIMRSTSSIRNEQLRHQSFSGRPSTYADQSRPGSRGSVRSETAPSQYQHRQPQRSFSERELQQQTEINYNEDGHPRKRAKVTQTDWRGKSSFGSTKTSDLRVTAATASSMHMFRPIAKRPTAPGSDLEPPPRVPTPVPQRTLLPRPGRQTSSGPRSMLRQASTVDSDLMSDVEPMSDAMTSPDGSSPNNSITAEGTPMDIPSSPPLIPGFNLPTPSSPGLPSLPSARMADSGYMSERGFHSGNIMESLEQDESRTQEYDTCDGHLHDPIVKIEGSLVGDASQYMATSDFNVPMNALGEKDLRSQKQTSGPPDGQGHRPPLASAHRQRSTTAEHPPSETSPSYSETPQPEGFDSRRGSLALPLKPLARAASDQGTKRLTQQKRKSLQRSHTATLDSEAGSPAPSDNESGPRGNARSGSAAPRRKVIEQRLSEAIARGEAPVYCAHCGAIETPTWRKIYVKTMEGCPGPLDSVEGEGETIGVQALDTNEDTGEVTRFLIRKTMKKTKDSQPGKGFVETNVCNPCGLWFNKFRNMRPKEKWHRKSNNRKRRSKTDDNLHTDGAEPPSEAFFTDQIVPEDAVEENTLADDYKEEPSNGSGAVPGTRRPRANSLQDQSFRHSSGESDSDRPRLAAAMGRETQSSPAQLKGSQESPIEVDLTPKPTRRLLFPSPRQSGEMKSLEDGPRRKSPSPSGKYSEKITSLTAIITDGDNNVDVFKALTVEKENMAPLIDDTDEFAHLFEGSPSAVFKTPLPQTPSKRTPPSKRKASDMLLKTPTQSSRKRQALTPNQNAANNADHDSNDLVTSPSSARYYLRSTPSRLERTPGGHSLGFNGEPSPFSRHLAQMLNESNGINDGVFTSPSRQFDFSDLPTFTTPGREVDWKGLDEILSSEFATYDDNNGLGFDGEAQQGGEHE